MWNVTDIREGMEVVGSCGRRVGEVDRVDGVSIRLSKYGPEAAGRHHYIPLRWVNWVNEVVHLDLACEEVVEEWRVTPIWVGG